MRALKLGEIVIWPCSSVQVMGLGCPVLIALQCLKSNVHLLLMYAAFKVCTHTALTWTGIQPKA